MDIDDERETVTVPVEVTVVAGERDKEKVAKMAQVDVPTILSLGGDTGGNMGGAIGGGMGAGLLGGMLGGLLFGGRGLGGVGGIAGDGAVGGIVTPALLAASLAQVSDTAMSTTLLQTLGDIKASVPLAEGQVQLALAGAVGEIRSHIGNVENGLTTGQAMINKNISDAIATSLASQNNINTNVLQTSTANLMATTNAQFALTTAVNADGEKTRALIVAQNDAELNRIIINQAAELAEIRNEGNRDRDRHGIEINMINNQNQNQMQFQQQQQILGTLAHCLADVQQVARATNSNVIVGNTGASTTGPQTANPTNVRA